MPLTTCSIRQKASCGELSTKISGPGLAMHAVAAPLPSVPPSTACLVLDGALPAIGPNIGPLRRTGAGLYAHADVPLSSIRRMIQGALSRLANSIGSWRFRMEKLEPRPPRGCHWPRTARCISQRGRLPFWSMSRTVQDLTVEAGLGPPTEPSTQMKVPVPCFKPS